MRAYLPMKFVGITELSETRKLVVMRQNCGHKQRVYDVAKRSSGGPRTG